MTNDFSSRTELLLGADGLEKLAEAGLSEYSQIVLELGFFHFFPSWLFLSDFPFSPLNLVPKPCFIVHQPHDIVKCDLPPGAGQLAVCRPDAYP